MPPKDKKTPEKGERKKRKTSPKEKATVIRDEPERNLFLECLQSTNQPPTAIDLSVVPRRKSTRNLQSTPSQSTPSPSTRKTSPKRKEHIQQPTRASSPNAKEECPHDQHSPGENSPKRSGIFKIHTSLNKEGQNENFLEWQRERAAGHTHHAKYIEWLTERIDDNRQLSREAEEQQRGRRLIAGLVGWGKGLYSQPITSVTVMSKEKEEITPVQGVMVETSAPDPAEEQTSDPMTSSEGPLLSGSIPPEQPLLPGTVTKFPQDFNAESTESDRSDKSLGTDTGIDITHGTSSDGTSSDGNIEVNYDGTSSDEQRLSPENQQVPVEGNQPPCAQHTAPEQINQSIQQINQSVQQINQDIQQPCAQGTNTKTINPAGQDENQTFSDKQSTCPTLENPINPTGLTPIQWEKQKSIYTNMLDGYTSPGGTHVNIHNLMMLAFTQCRQDGESQFNIMAQNHANINYMAQQQKELLERQAATIQAGTDMVLAAQKQMIEAMEAKQSESLKQNDSHVRELMARLTQMEVALATEKIKCLEFEAALAIERQNKRRASSPPENARGGKARSTGPEQHEDLNSTPAIPQINSSSSVATEPRVCPIPAMSAAGLPVSKKFSPPLIMSTRSPGRKPPQAMIDAMTAPPPKPSSQRGQPANQPFQSANQPFQPVNQQPVIYAHPRLNRPTKYPSSIIRVQGYQRTVDHINQSVGAWKKTLQDQRRYLPEEGRLSEETCESYLRQLSSALKNHHTGWASYQNEGIHEDYHGMFKHLQATFNIPKHYQNPDLWYANQQRSALHCLGNRCVSVWWYYDQLMRDIPGFQHNDTPSTTRTNQRRNQPRWGVPQDQLQRPQYTALQENIADAAAIQRQLALHHHAPEPHADMEDLDSWDIQYDDLMHPDHRAQVADLTNEIKRIKQRNVSKIYADKRTRIIKDAEEARQCDRNSPQIPLFLFNVKTPWSSGCGQANDAYDQDKIYGYEQQIAQLRNTNARLCQMEISSSQHGPTGRGAL
jgi:hypothetical protein